MGAEESTLGGDEGGDEVSILVNTVPGDSRDGSTAPPPSSGETGGKEKGRKVCYDSSKNNIDFTGLASIFLKLSWRM